MHDASALEVEEHVEVNLDTLFTNELSEGKAESRNIHYSALSTQLVSS